MLQLEYERQRLIAILVSGQIPDTFMDLSIGRYDNPLYKDIIRIFGCPVGIVPAYLFNTSNRISNTEALTTIKQLADDGIAFITLHLTATKELLDIATKTRRIPVTSRGGSIVLRQILDSDKENIWLSILPEIIRIVKDYKMVISLGSTFRPAGISDACDEVHVKETLEQLKLCRLLQAEDVQVILENVGHISLDNIEKHCEMLKQFNAPIMPLGPIPTDCAENEDHIASAIGASMMGYRNCAHIINCITRSEHSRSVFSIDDTLEAIKTAKLAAHIIDVSKGINVNSDTETYTNRARKHSCLVKDGVNCSRCSFFCPLKNI